MMIIRKSQTKEVILRKLKGKQNITKYNCEDRNENI